MRLLSASVFDNRTLKTEKTVEMLTGSAFSSPSTISALGRSFCGATDYVMKKGRKVY